MNSAADINQICHSFKRIQKNDGTSYDHKGGSSSGTIYYTDVLRNGLDFIGREPEIGRLFKMPGEGKDWNAFILFHELEHSRDDADGKPSSEFTADMAARRHYQEALQQGLVKDLGVPDALRGVRAMQEMKNGFGMDDFDVHGVAALAGLPGININGQEDERQAASEMGGAKYKIYREIGAPLVSEKQKADFLAEGTILSVPSDEWNLDAKHEAMLDRYRQENYQDKDEQRLTDLKEVLKGAHLSEDAQKRANRGAAIYFDKEAATRGREAVNQDMPLLYETARKMYLQGKFNDDPTGKAFVGEFVRAAENYAQNLFKTDNRQTFVRPENTEQRPQAPQPVAAPVMAPAS